MKKIFIILIMLVALSVNGQWVYQYTANQYSFLNKIQFPTDNTGYAVGELDILPRSVFLKTTNGGTNWINMNISLSFPTDLIEMSFANENTGYICGRSVDIYKTTNGGINWLTIQVPYFGNQIWNSMQFLDVNTGFIAGRYGMRSKTTNGGVNWISMDTTWSDIYDLYFLNTSTGFMAEGSSNVLKTTNGGTNWTTSYLKDTNGVGYSLQKIYFSNSNTGYIAGINTVTGAIFKTTDNGTTWKNILITPYGLLSIIVVNNTKLYAGSEDNILYYSSNSGLTWSNQTIQTPIGGINSIYFTNITTGYLTINNEIYKTTNGGVGIINISTEIPDEFRLLQNYPNPFNPATKIRFSIANGFLIGTFGNGKVAVMGNKKVVLKVYDVMGREVQTLVNETLKPGTYEVMFDASRGGPSSLNSGVYFYKLTIHHGASSTGDFTETKKMLLIK